METDYRRYLDALFNNNEAKGTTFYWEDKIGDLAAAEMDLFTDKALCVEVLSTAFGDFDRHLAHFSAWQLATGLHYIFSAGISDLYWAFLDESLPAGSRAAGIRKLTAFFDLVFTPDCEPALGHLSQCTSDINFVCYMFWDTTYLTGKDLGTINDASLDVMAHCLKSDNIAVVESGLHGLGHAVATLPRAGEIIDGYLNRHKGDDTPLFQYARNARTGCVL